MLCLTDYVELHPIPLIWTSDISFFGDFSNLFLHCSNSLVPTLPGEATTVSQCAPTTKTLSSFVPQAEPGMMEMMLVPVTGWPPAVICNVTRFIFEAKYSIQLKGED